MMSRAIVTLRADARALPLADGSVHCCVTSPPYWKLRDYGYPEQLGMEDTPDEYVAALVGVFREVRRVLRDDGTLWLNLGDSYASGPGGGQGKNSHFAKRSAARAGVRKMRGTKVVGDLKPKDLVGVPWRVAFALQADGWYLRSEIIWHKPNAQPSSVTDRCTSAHEHVFMLAKSERYFYDAAAVREPSVSESDSGNGYARPEQLARQGRGQSKPWTRADNPMRNRRDVWSIPTTPYAGAHFAVMPEALATPCILAGSPEGGMVLDPFAGTGTVGRVAVRHRRGAFLVERGPGYLAMIDDRTSGLQVGLPAMERGQQERLDR